MMDERELIEDPITGVLVDPETGEVMGLLEEPEEMEDAEGLAHWLGQALTSARAQLVGLQAEKQAWLDKVAEQFDSSIRRAEGKVRWLSERPDWLEMLRTLHEKRAPGKPSFKLGLLATRIKKSRESLEITDEEQALEFVREHCPDAIQVRESLLKTHIPPEVRQALPADAGLIWHPAGETETFEVV